MESLFILIPLSVIAVVIAVLVFFKMSEAGQFDDDQGPAWSILLDDDHPISSRVTDASDSSDASVDMDQRSR